MSASARSLSAPEATILERLRDRYESQGFKFVAEPKAEALPAFMQGYVPDAIASRSGVNVAIEVKRDTTDVTQRQAQWIKSLFDSQPDWQFRIVYANDDQALASQGAPPTREDVLSSLEEAQTLQARGHAKAAFLMAWALLEAALNARRGEARPRGPSVLLQSLAMHGFISPEVERRMRPLVQLRNRVAHGDLSASVELSDVQTVIEAVRMALELDAN